MKKLLEAMPANEQAPVREAVRITVAAVALHAILSTNRFSGLSKAELAQGAVNLADELMKALDG